MKMIADTNVLLRLVVEDDARQTHAAVEAMEKAETVVIGRHALCELAWVLRSRYGVSKANIAAAIRMFCEMEKAEVDQAAVDAGLAMMEAGADFADGVIAYEGRWLGGETFVSFDHKAVAALEQAGKRARLLG
jgi:predicted nucleic-acid-binding protein